MTTPKAPEESSRAEPRPRRSWSAWPWQSAGAACLLALLAWAWLAPSKAPESGASAGSPARVAASTSDGGAPLESALRGDRFVEGRVQDDRGLPLAEARIEVRAPGLPGTAMRLALSDAEGRFRFQDLPRLPLSFDVSREGHESQLRVLAADQSGQVVMMLTRQGELRVSLRDVPGRSVADAELLLTGPSIWPAQAARADARGEHVFRGLSPGPYQVRARQGERVARALAPVRVMTGARALCELVLEAGAQLTGVVVDQSTQQPLARAQVAVQDLTPGIDASVVRTDPQGRFVAGGLWPGLVRVEARAEGYAGTARELTLPLEAPITLALPGSVALLGTVVDDQGAGLGSVRLSVSTEQGLPVDFGNGALGGGELGVTAGPVPIIPLIPSDDFSLGTLAAESEPGGQFRISSLPPAELVLHAVKRGFVPERLTLRGLSPHEERRELRIVMRPGGRVVGRVSDARGEPIAGVYVAARSGAGEQSALTDVRGEFTIWDVLGPVQLEAQLDGQGALPCQTEAVSGHEARCDFRAERAIHELTLRVVDEYAMGIPGAQVTLRSDASERRITRLTGEDGSLRVRELPPPPYLVDVSRSGYLAISELRIVTLEGEHKVVLTRAASLAGSVLDALGRPVRGAFVGTEDGSVSGESDEHGSFILEQVPPGAHVVVAHHAQAGTGRSAEARARPQERIDGLRVVLSGRVAVGEPSAARLEERARPSERVEVQLEQRGRSVIVAQVAAGSRAARAGLRTGDALLSVDGEAPLSAAHARGLLRGPAGRTALLRIVRQKQLVQLRYRRP